MEKAYPFGAALATALFQLRKGLTDRSLEIRPDLSHHCAQIHPQLIQSGPSQVPVTAVNVMDGEIRQERKSVRHRCNASTLRGLRHIQHFYDFSFLIAQERKTRAESGSESIVDFGRVDAHDRELAIVNRKLLLKFHKMAQLHLALPSPIAAIERKDEGKLSNQL
jgi:hypothetical protein